MPKIIKKHSKKALILAIMFLLVMGYLVVPKTKAATITTREVRISNSTPSATNVIYDFLGTTTATNVQCIKVQFCTSADTSGACTAPTGINVDSGAVYDTPPYTWNVFTSGLWTYAPITGGDSNDFSLTYTPGESGGVSSSWVVSGITNPSAEGTFYAWINTYNDPNCASNPVDNGVVATATVSAITASATVLETLTFTVTEIAGASCLTQTSGHGGNPINTTTTTIPFGTVTPEQFYNGCMDLAVSTNADKGYTVTIGESDQLTEPVGNNKIPDGNCDGQCNEIDVAPWRTSTNNGFAYCMKDKVGDGAATADNEWLTEGCGDTSEGFKIIPDIGESEERQSIMASTSEVADTAEIDYSLSVDTIQAAGTYSTTITYIVTPTY